MVWLLGGVQAAPRLTGVLGAGSTNTAGAWERVSMLISYKMGTLLGLPWQHNPIPRLALPVRLLRQQPDPPVQVS